MWVNIYTQEKKNHTANKKKMVPSIMAGSNKPNKSYLQKLSNNSFPILPDVNKLHVFAQSIAVFSRKIQTPWNKLVQNMKANHFDSCVVVPTSQNHPNKKQHASLSEFTFFHLPLVSQ